MEEFSFEIPLDATTCESCGEGIWVGWNECPHCKTGRVPGTEEEAHLYRARVDVFKSLVLATREINPTGSVPVTDAQYLNYIDGSGVFDEGQLRVAETANALEIRDVGSTRSAETRDAACRLTRTADRCRRLLSDLKVVRPSGRFADAHPHVVRTFENIHRMLGEMALGLTAWHPRDIHLHKDGVQEAFDGAHEELSLLEERWDEVDASGLFDDTQESRMESLTGSRPAAEVSTLSDLSAMGFGDFAKFMSRGPEGYGYFSDLLRTSLEDMPDEVPPALYMLALLVNSVDDPAGVRSRASLFLEVLHEARAEDSAAMLEAAVSVQDSLGEAGATLASLGPLVEALLKTPGLPEDSLRTFLLNAYKDLTEGSFKHVANLFLFAAFIRTGSPKSWEDVAEWSTFGEKHQWLANWGDEPAVTAALEGVEKMVRNSDSHRTYEHLEGGVRLVQPDFRHRKNIEKVLVDEEFGDLVADLMRTILSLSIAAQLFQFDHIGEISEDLREVGTHRALRPTFLQLFLGIFGLVDPSAVAEGSRVEAKASVAAYLTLSPVDEYFKGLVFVGALYGEAEVVGLTVEHHGEWYCTVSAPNERLRAMARGANPATVLALLLSAKVSSAGSPARTDDEKLRELGLSVGSRMLINHLVTEVEPLLLSEEPRATEVVRQTAQMLADFKEALLIPQELSGDAKRQRDRFIAAVGEMRRYVVTNLRVRAGVLKDARALDRALKHYRGGAGVLNEIAGSSPVLERIF